ncbi:hypothetical protein CSHISOI_03715 [Colletotrichum shisoi]|uniref:Uncharacterized protein n=1 Tax=Colletotrichum shisoi TaxID=2078593 RepID=A0A5Q4BXH7_9PEZI|nr:hypothetical protein CSHISOI_03715 [Colletotrichum shisoi]
MGRLVPGGEDADPCGLLKTGPDDAEIGHVDRTKPGSDLAPPAILRGEITDYTDITADRIQTPDVTQIPA